MQIASADYKAMKQLKTFEDKHELDNTVRSFLYHFKHEITPSAALTLKTLSRYAVKIPGVCWAKVGTLAQIIGKASRTIQRALKQLEYLGIIERIKTIRKEGGYGHPVIVINKMSHLVLPDNVTSGVTSEMSPRQESRKLCEAKDEQPKKEPETKIFKTKSFREKKNDIRNPDTEQIRLDETFVDKRVPKEFIEQAKYGFNAIEIDKLWNRVRIAMKKINYTIMNETEISIDALKQTIKRYKENSIRKEFGAYFYTTVKIMLQKDQEEWDREYEAEKRRKNPKPEKAFLYYDWIQQNP
ncbi:hypothetical protein J22TS1_43320 [Siminovitchia terrae]|uniref:helix-turn-helix domain-containing protein n=1 Tax=Siminovitchia terrae TaxID=1914933 RepID=UPI001B2AFF2D|nr:helix-turn-helix domain-containing protein [Siminovitchia terrae]GIN93281.1 hypothetical protein J22TS1_43320 [Siminovitchia terrae]